MTTRLSKFMAPAALGAAALAWAGPVLAGTGAGAPDGYGYHHGWGGGMWHGGWGGGMVFGPLLGLLFIAVATVVVVWVVRAMMGGRCRHGRCGHRHAHGAGSSALSILEERLAKGEIDTAEFAERKKALTGE